MSREEQYLDAEHRYLRTFLGDLSKPTRQRLGYDHPADHPHVRFLLDAAARLNARLRRLLQVGPERFANNLQELHAPDSTAPVPGFAVLAVRPPPDGRPLDLPRGYAVHPSGYRGVPFRTTAAVRVRPVSVTAIAAGRFGQWPDLPREAAPAEAVLRFTLASTHPDGFAGLNLTDPLRLHLAGEGADPLPYELHEAVFADRLGVWVRDRTSSRWFAADLTPGGLTAEERLLGDGRAEFPGERRLRDFFAFHPKFLFVDLHGLGPAARTAGAELEVAVGFRRPRPGLVGVQPRHLLTNCVPVVNLRELPLPPTTAGAMSRGVDVARALDDTAGAEVYAVRQVRVDTADGPRAVPHWLPGRAAHPPAADGLRWHAERFRPTPTHPLGRVVVRLLDPATRPTDLTGLAVHLTVEVMNGRLPAEVRGVREYRAETDGGVTATAVRLPTTVLRPRLDSAGGWPALTLPTLNSLALGGGAAGARTFAGGLAGFALLDAACDAADPDEQDRKAFAESLLSGLTEAEVTPDEAWDGGWVPGRHYRLKLGHARHRPGSGFLFGTVLEAFLADTATFDAFVRTTATTPTATHTWPATVGEEPL